MNANYIYDIFQTCEDLDLPDLTIALAHYQRGNPIPDGMTDKGVREFIGDHYKELVEAFAAHDREIFAAAVEAAIRADEEQEEGAVG